MLQIFVSGSAAERVTAAREFVESFPSASEVLLVGASRDAVDDLAREIAFQRGVRFGLHRFSLTQLAAYIAAARLAGRGLSPATALGVEAIATRATFEARREGVLTYFAPVAQAPGFPRALARTLTELRLSAADLARLGDFAGGPRDLQDLLKRCDQELDRSAIADRAALFSTACEMLDEGQTRFAGVPLVLLDVAIETMAERDLVSRLVAASPRALATVPAGDGSTAQALRAIAGDTKVEKPSAQQDDSTLGRLRAFLFSERPALSGPIGDDLIVFSAPGEGRECVEIARRLLAEAERGIRFDAMAVLLRSPENYIGLLEHALARADIPAYFDYGTRRPEPSGRAFLGLLACAVDGLSGRRFAEYLSLGQVPRLDAATPPERAAEWQPPSDDVFGPAARPSSSALVASGLSRKAELDDRALDPDAPDRPEIEGTLRTPWKWERLIGEAVVIKGKDRWVRRLNGLAAEYELKLGELTADDPDSPRIAGLRQDLRNLSHLRAFALPIIEELASWPAAATWGEWLSRFEAFAPRVLRFPSRVVQVLLDLRPMSEVGPITLREARDVLADRLGRLQEDPPPVRYGRVFVGTPSRARGRAFDVVFVPGLAERIFPRRPREDPLLLDDLRRALDHNLPIHSDPQRERLLLRLAAGAARRRLYLSYPRMDVAEARPRVPSFYALDVVRAVTGRVPPHEELERSAEDEARASLAWPAPPDPSTAIDDLEHDLAVIRPLLQASPSAVKGKAQYLLRLNEFLRESLIDRWFRWSDRWTPRDGLVRPIEPTRAALEGHRLHARPYSTSALQRYAVCPYQFLLSAIYKIKPMEEPEPLQRMDPLTKGQIFHRMQAEFFRALVRERARPEPSRRVALTPEGLAHAHRILDATIERVAAGFYELLAPAIERVWSDEIAAIRMDLRAWLRMVVEEGGPWQPEFFELGFGLDVDAERDPHSVPEPVVLADRFVLRGSVDLVERRRDVESAAQPSGPVFRVTDHKTGRNRSRPHMVIGGGMMLQPVLYSLAVERILGAPVLQARLFYCTTAGNFHPQPIEITDGAKRLGIEALEIIDRAIETAVLPPAPYERACEYCDFRPVCGSEEPRRIAGKKTPPLLLGDLRMLRTRP